MHNVYLLQRFVSDHIVLLAKNSTPSESITDHEKECESDTILYYAGHEKFLLF